MANGEARCSRRKGTWLVAMTAAAVGCSSGGGAPAPAGSPPAAIAQVEIVPGSLLLTAPGQGRLLTARALDAQGAEVPTTFSWTSSRPGDVEVDSVGRLTARAIGSTQVVAEAGGVKSPAALVLVAETAPGAILASDAQIASVGPVISTPAQGPGVGTQYEVRLKGISPAPAAGVPLLASESAQVAGRVVSTRDEAGALVAVLELRPLHELLGRYRINWDLPVVPEGAGAQLAGASLAAEGSSGALVTSREAPSLLTPFHAIDCDGRVDAALFKKAITLSPSSSLRWQVTDVRDDPAQAPSHVKHVLVGQFTLDGTVELGLNASITAGGGCLAQLPPIRIAAFGAASVLVMPAVRLGVGIDLSAALTAASGTVGLTGKVGLQPEIGWECGPPPLPCRGLASLSQIADVTPKQEVPSVHGSKVTLSAQVFALAGLDLAVLGGLAGYFGIAEARIGPKQSGSFATEDDQAHQPDASSYDLKLSGSVHPGAGLAAAIKQVIDDDAVGVDLRFERSLDLAESPKGTLFVDKTRSGIGESVKLTVDITPATARYAGLDYNVVSISILRRKPGEELFQEEPDLRMLPTASNQTHFEKVWKPVSTDVGTNELAAFVHTEVHDTGVLPLLEIAPDTRKTVEVQAFCLTGQAPVRAALGAVPQAGPCQVQGTLRHTSSTDAPPSQVTTAGEATVILSQDVAASTPERIVFRPTGTCTLRSSGTNGLCTFSAVSTSCVLQADRSELDLDLVPGSDPPRYTYSGSVGADVVLSQTMTCPSGTTTVNIPTIEPLFLLPGSEARPMPTDGHAVGAYTLADQVTGQTWTWDLTLQVPSTP